MQSFCWWCGKKLQLPFYTVVTDQLGHRQKIHKCCKPDAEKEIRPATAQPKPANADMLSDGQIYAETSRRANPEAHVGLDKLIGKLRAIVEKSSGES